MFKGRSGARVRVLTAVAAVVAVLGAPLVAGGSAPAAAAGGVVFTEDFESGTSSGWSFYSNGRNATQTIVSAPVHGGTAALQGAATADPQQSEIGIAHIRDGLSIAEDNSLLTFWYHAAGTAAFRSLVVEARTVAGSNYFTSVPAGVSTGVWTKVDLALRDISPQLVGQTVDRIVVKAVVDPAAGDAQFTVDDVSVENGVQPPPALSLTSPTAGATGVWAGRVLTGIFNTALERASVTDSAVRLTANGRVMTARAAYAAGQRAVMIVPDRPLPPDAVVTAEISGVRSAAGAALPAPVSWSFRTAARAMAPAAQREVVFADGFSSETGWRFFSSAATATAGVVAAPAHGAPGALRGSGTDPDGPFAVSHIKDRAWLDENGAIDFWYLVEGDAALQSVVVAVTTAAGFTRFTTIDAGAVPVGTWKRVRIGLAQIDPGLVGQQVRNIELKLETSTGGTASFTIDDVAVAQSLAGYSQLPASAPDAPATSAAREARLRLGAATIRRIDELAQQILASQQPDGSIVVGPVGEPWSFKVDPYASHYAALGLLRVYQLTDQTRYLDAADRWLGWYQDQMNEDGIVNDCFGYYPNCVDSGDHDSVDSYASTYLLAVYRRAQVTRGDAARAAYLRSAAPYVTKAIRALDTVYLTDGTTIAKESYPVRFAMDNAETYNGLIAASKLSVRLGDRSQARISHYLAARTLYAMRQRYVTRPSGHIAVAVHPDGSQEAPLQRWFPDALASVLTVSHLGNRGDAALYDRLVQQFDVDQAAERPTAFNDTPQYMWWAQAALRVGDPGRARHFVAEYESIEGRNNPATLAITAGHLVRVLTFGWDHSLWF